MAIGIFFILTFARTLFTLSLILESTNNIHRKMSSVLLRAKILFFDTNPVGRILTRFTKDMVVFD